jgi:hypothetical protein
MMTTVEVTRSEAIAAKSGIFRCPNRYMKYVLKQNPQVSHKKVFFQENRLLERYHQFWMLSFQVVFFVEKVGINFLFKKIPLEKAFFVET